MEHLSEHTQIKNIKVVRDSKGGVCAFVQCEVREISLIFVVKKLMYICASECNIRYSFDTDFAIQCPQAVSRSQFTLRACKGVQDTTCVLPVVIFLSFSQSHQPCSPRFSTPTQIARHGNINDSSDTPKAEIELELPDAMRIWKQRHSRSLPQFAHWHRIHLFDFPDSTAFYTTQKQ